MSFTRVTLIVQQVLVAGAKLNDLKELWRINKHRTGQEQGTPAVGKISFGDLRRVKPLTHSFGYDRGQPIDRYYIEKFLSQHTRDTSGHVVEVGDDRYTRQFGVSALPALMCLIKITLTLRQPL